MAPTTLGNYVCFFLRKFLWFLIFLLFKSNFRERKWDLSVDGEENVGWRSKWFVFFFFFNGLRTRCSIKCVNQFTNGFSHSGFLLRFGWEWEGDESDQRECGRR